MPDEAVDDLITVDEAIAILDAEEIDDLDLVEPDAEVEFTLAHDVMADRDYPPFQKSLVDGYAVRRSDLAEASEASPVALKLVAEVAAGRAYADLLDSGETVAIMTGAPVPAGADAVVMIEATSREGDRVTFRAPVKSANIQPRGAEAKAGEVVIRKGTWFGARDEAAMAQVGAVDFDARPQVGVAILTTGDELIDPEAEPGPTEIRDANATLLEFLLVELGHRPSAPRTARDHPKKIREQVVAAFEPGVNVLLVTGGMSMGAHDHVPRVLRELGFEIRISKLRIKPGKPFVFAVRRRAKHPTQFVFGLPGNPLSAYVCTLRLASRLLDRLAGRTQLGPLMPLGVLASDLPANGPREFYQPAAIESDGRLRPLEWKGSADVFTLARADALIIRPIDDAPRAAGQSVRFLQLL